MGLPQPQDKSTRFLLYLAEADSPSREDAVAGLQFEVTKRKRVDNKTIYVEYPRSRRTLILVDLEVMTVEELAEQRA